jgi:hypothetical protein
MSSRLPRAGISLAAVMFCAFACGSRTPIAAVEIVANPAVTRCHTCPSLQIECGTADDGCGGKLVCGSCAFPKSCAGDGVAGHCGCQATTCDALGAECGDALDG